MLADWFDNGRIDRLYPLNCYEEAIDAIPDDLRDYADAEDVITRALQAALRRQPRSRRADPTPERRRPLEPGLERWRQRTANGRRRRLRQQPTGSAGRRHVGPVVGADSPARAGRNVDRAARSRRARIPLATPERSRHRRHRTTSTRSRRASRRQRLQARGGYNERLVRFRPICRDFCADTYRPARSLPSPARSHDDHRSPGRGDVLSNSVREEMMATAEQAQVTEKAADEVVNTVVDAETSVAPKRYFTVPGHRSVRRDRVGAARRAHPRQGRPDLRAEGRRVPEVLVADRDEHRRAEVLPRPHGLARARALRQADDRPRRRHDRRLGP